MESLFETTGNQFEVKFKDFDTSENNIKKSFILKCYIKYTFLEAPASPNNQVLRQIRCSFSPFCRLCLKKTVRVTSQSNIVRGERKQTDRSVFKEFLFLFCHLRDSSQGEFCIRVLLHAKEIKASIDFFPDSRSVVHPASERKIPLHQEGVNESIFRGQLKMIERVKKLSFNQHFLSCSSFVIL